MSARGAKATGQNIYLWKNEDSSYEYVPAVGASGAAGGYQSAGGTTNGSKGGNGLNRATGGRRIWAKKLWNRRSWWKRNIIFRWYRRRRPEDMIMFLEQQEVV